MKRVIVLFLVAVLAFAFVGCSSVNEEDRIQMIKIVNDDVEKAKADFNSSLRYYTSEFECEHKGASEYQVTGKAYFKGEDEYTVNVSYTFVKQSDGSFEIFSSDISDFLISIK